MKERVTVKLETSKAQFDLKKLLYYVKRGVETNIVPEGKVILLIGSTGAGILTFTFINQKNKKTEQTFKPNKIKASPQPSTSFVEKR